MGREADAVTFLAALADAPYRHDFYQTLRRLECLYSDKPRWGRALRPGDEPVRLGQDPDLAFAPAPLASFEPGEDGAPPRLQVRLFGLLGPNGPLPMHITEYARERLRNAGDRDAEPVSRLFHHRFLALFYRAWAQAQPHVNRDRPHDDHFAVYIGALLGRVARRRSASATRCPISPSSFMSARSSRQVRNADGLAAILQHFFRVPVASRSSSATGWRWPSASGRASRAEGAVLGGGAVLGSRVWDRQHKFRIRLGPLTLRQYESFLPGRRRRCESSSTGCGSTSVSSSSGTCGCCCGRTRCRR